jgi:hypothetical protein
MRAVDQDRGTSDNRVGKPKCGVLRSDLGVIGIVGDPHRTVMIQSVMTYVCLLLDRSAFNED